MEKQEYREMIAKSEEWNEFVDDAYDLSIKIFYALADTESSEEDDKKCLDIWNNVAEVLVTAKKTTVCRLNVLNKREE